MKDSIPVYNLRADSGELGADGNLKLGGYHELLCRIIESDQRALGCALKDTLQHGYAWAMISLSMQVCKPVDSCDRLYGQTWLSEMNYPHLRREIEIYDESHSPVLCASIFMVPINTNTHQIHPEEQLDRFSCTIIPEFSVDWAQSRLQTIHDQRYQPLDMRTVRPSDIDALGHLNNCRYGAYVYDALAVLGQNYTDSPFTYTMHFMRQCMSGTKIRIGAYIDNGAVHLLGTGIDDKLKRFGAIVKPL